jgi:hypothetical protein
VATKSIAGHAVPGIVLFFVWLVLIVLAIILMAWLVHLAGGGLLDLRLGHFRLDVGFT